MIQAELKGKLPELENSEDALTSCVFGLIKYIPIDKGLFKILEKTKDYNSGRSILHNNPSLTQYDSVEYYFWEKSSKYGEPDIILLFSSKNQVLEPVILVIEIKYYSLESRDNQLKDYYIALSDEYGRRTFSNNKLSNFKGNFLGLVYLTYYPQKEEVENTIRKLTEEYVSFNKKTIYQLKWGDLAKIFKNYPLNKSYDSTIAKDIFSILNKKNLIGFEGWSKVCPKLNVLLEKFLKDKTVFYRGKHFFECWFHVKSKDNDMLGKFNKNKSIFYRGGNYDG